MKETHVPSLLLMEGAAHAIYRQLLETLPKDAKILAVSGPGNNGADAIAVARLFLLGGGEADVLLIGDPIHTSIENQQQQAIFEGYGGVVTTDPGTVDFNQYDAIIEGAVWDWVEPSY
ncbi:MAG: NAD(P)H-hydrate epimerase [Aerococcus sp.]|nr:NAD(P)H-hydrate epimerase [Aerococcus sp.]